jgi:excisionase family DNA binding protein
MAQVIEINNKKTAQRTTHPVARLMTVKQAAFYIGHSVPSMRDMLYRRELQCIQKGKGKVWIDIKDLDQWIEQSKGYM